MKLEFFKGWLVLLFILNDSFGYGTQHIIQRREVSNMDCASVGPLNNVCIVLTPMSDQTGVRATLMVGDRQIVSGMLTGRNPPGFPCVPIFVPIMTAACLQVRDIQVGRGGFMACPEVALINVSVVRFRCITVGPQGVSFQTVNTPNTNGGVVEIDL